MHLLCRTAHNMTRASKKPRPDYSKRGSVAEAMWGQRCFRVPTQPLTIRKVPTRPLKNPGHSAQPGGAV
jgi:hypothetical protein